MADRFRIVLSGTLTASEVFAHRHHLTSTVVTTAQAIAVASAAAWAAGADAGFLENFPNTTTWNRITAYGLNADGSPDGDLGQVIINQMGSSTLKPLPNQCAWVVTLRTSDLSRRGRGRMFLPAPDSGHLGNAGRVLPTSVAQVATGIQTYLNTLNTAGTTCCIRSDAAPASLPAFKPITSLDMGDVLDTIRARRDAMVETRTNRPITQG